MTTAILPTLDELLARLEAERAEAEAAKTALGAAALDTTDPRKASKRVVDAEAAVTRTEAAIDELARREAVQTERDAAVATASENVRIYAWIAEWHARAANVASCRDQLKAAEEHLQAHPPTSNLLYRFVRHLDRKLDHEVPFDADAARRVPYGKNWPARTAEELKKLSVDQLEERRAQALELAEAEQARLEELEGQRPRCRRRHRRS